MATITFDGPTKKIIIGYDGPITEVNAIDIYSAWKDWVKLGNAQFAPAFAQSVGGNSIGAGLSISGYFFIRNDAGWTISPSENDYEIRINGDLYPQDPGVLFLNPTVGNFTVSFVLQRSAASYVSAVGTSGLTTEESETLDLIKTIPAHIWAASS